MEYLRVLRQTISELLERGIHSRLEGFPIEN
jgi:hypothetical protein